MIFIDKDIKIIDETTSTTRTLETETKIIQNTENFPSEINDSAINNPELIPLDNLKGNEQKNEDVEFLQVI